MTSMAARMFIPPGFPNANIVAYLTAPGNPEPPRITATQLKKFLEILREGWYLFKAIDHDWVDKVSESASSGAYRLKYSSKDHMVQDVLPAKVIKQILRPLRELFERFDFFGLVATRAYDGRLEAFVNYASVACDQKGLFLSPHSHPTQDDLTFLDPFPTIVPLIEQPENWPGILFWSQTGSTAFAPIKDAERLFLQILDSIESHKIDEVLASYGSNQSSHKFLHLSDLHFGTNWASENEAYLLAHLDALLRSVDRVIITGDLFNNPLRSDAIAFRNFRASLTRVTGKDTIVIPGNHDQKWLGNVGSALGELANLEWSNLVIDDEMRCVFFCFDSSREANLAKGCVTKRQLMEVATDFETKCVGNPNNIVDHLRVALIHHHPFSFEAEKETIIQRGLQAIGITDEYFLRMDDADTFISWCLSRKIPLILHGHKHVQRHVSKRYLDKHFPISEITSVGCGASLGAEGKPLSYNILAWNPPSKSWAVSFYSDPGDGSGFTRQQITQYKL